MSRLSNLNTLRIGIFGNWYSSWYDNEYYTFLVFKDYKLIEYLNSIFYRLRLPTTHFYINRINQKYYYIESNIYITKPVLRRTTKSIHKNKDIFRYLSIIEYLFDVIFLLPSNFIADKKMNFISYLYISNNVKSYFFYSLYNIHTFYNNNLFFSSFNYLYLLDYLMKMKHIYNISLNISFFLNNNKLLNSIEDNNLLYNIDLLYNKFKFQNKNTDNNIFYMFSNFFKIDSIQKIKFFNFKKKINQHLKKKNKINIYFLKFISFVYNKKNWFSLLLNTNFLNFFNSIKKFFYLYVSFFINIFFELYLVLSLNINIKEYSFVFLNLEKLILNFYYLIKKNNLLSNYKLYIKTNFKFNFLRNQLDNSLFLPIESSISHRFNPRFRNIEKQVMYEDKYYINHKFNKFIHGLFSNQYGFFSYFYLKDFDTLSRRSNSNVIQTDSEYVDAVHYKNINKFNNFFKRINIHFNNQFFRIFNNLIEKTIYFFTGLECFFLPVYYINSFPSFDTKLLMDYISYNLKRRHNITKIFNRIGRLQKKLHIDSSKMLIPLFNELNSLNINVSQYKKYIPLFNFNTIFTAASFGDIYNEQIKKKKNPISGIRIEFSGPPKKEKK